MSESCVCVCRIVWHSRAAMVECHSQQKTWYVHCWENLRIVWTMTGSELIHSLPTSTSMIFDKVLCPVLLLKYIDLNLWYSSLFTICLLWYESYYKFCSYFPCLRIHVTQRCQMCDSSITQLTEGSHSSIMLYCRWHCSGSSLWKGKFWPRAESKAPKRLPKIVTLDFDYLCEMTLCTIFGLYLFRGGECLLGKCVKYHFCIFLRLAYKSELQTDFDV